MLSIALAGASSARNLSTDVQSGHSQHVAFAIADPGGNTFATGLTLTGDYTPPVTWTISAGTLPEGLELAEGSGLIPGVPTTPGSSD